MAIVGLVITDLSVHGHFTKIQNWSLIQRSILQFSLLGFGLTIQWIPIIRDSVNKAFAVLNVQDHPELKFVDSIFVVIFLLLIEISPWAQNVLNFSWFVKGGKLSAGIYLLAPSIVFGLIPHLALAMHDQHYSGSTILGVSWLVLFVTASLGGGIFWGLVQVPSKWVREKFREGMMRDSKQDEGEKVTLRAVRA